MNVSELSLTWATTVIKLPLAFTEEILSQDFLGFDLGIFESLLRAQTTIE